ncbi:MAG: IS110 family transposase [Bacilli bacterium]|nr:IS110 family transposase [Bacilli bacterium]
MNSDERKVLSILVNTNKTLFDAQKSNKHRINAIKNNMQDARVATLEQMSIVSLDNPLLDLRGEINAMLQFSREYLDVLQQIPSVNLYDAAEIIVEVGDIRRFENIRHFISYAGLAPVVKKGKYYSKVKKYNNGIVVANKKQDPVDYCENLKVVLTRCAKKLSYQSHEYKMYYEEMFDDFKYKHPTYPKKRLENMALKKTTIRFADYIFKEFNKIAEFEEAEAND